MRASEVVETVYNEFEGKAPLEDGAVLLDAIVMAVLHVLQDRGFIDLEDSGTYDA